jgi:hypothetical protein
MVFQDARLIDERNTGMGDRLEEAGLTQRLIDGGRCRGHRGVDDLDGRSPR